MKTKSFLLVFLMCIIFFFMYSCKKDEEWKVVKISGPIKVHVSGSLEAPTIRWDEGQAYKIIVCDSEQSIWYNINSEESMWYITDNLSSPVNYSEVPEGATVVAGAKPLEKGIKYSFGVYWSRITIGTTNEGYGFAYAIYE
ncbi:MAG: hypothetical protein KAT68_07805 [Bacteroidales bacterium]|nr:hypothetical protein [Bacteroidales bacterium]